MILKNVQAITQFGFGEGAEPVTMYVTAVRAEDLLKNAEIFRRTPDRRDGYQREIKGPRLSKGKIGVPGYLLNQMGIFPTSFLLNIRANDGRVTFKEKTRIGNNIVIGDLEIPDNVSWYALDGQHRIEGLKIAIRAQEEFKDYPTIITLTNESLFYEMLMFYFVNDRQKSVPTDLVYRILQTMEYGENIPVWIKDHILTGADRRKAIAATIVDELNVDPQSPFAGRIQEVGEVRNDNHLISDGTIARYVAEVLREKIFRDMLDSEVAVLLGSYWGAIAEIYPKCFNEPGDYLLIQTLGLSSMMRLFPSIYGYTARDGDVSRNNMAKYLRYLLERTERHYDSSYVRPINENWWHRVDGEIGILRGTGEGHYKKVSDNLIHKLQIALRSKKGVSD